MSSDVVLRAEGLGKKYVIGHETERERYTALRDVIGRKAKNVLRTTSDMLRGRAVISGEATEEFWALKDVNFEIKRGEVLGIIGRNGAGKSTLLKILSRITEPTEGRVEIRGRVASLLEVGTGFHPELTGRENIYLNGAILGMTREEIKRKFDEIVAFAEVEKFLDTPVKRYSSGMYVRLAFAVAAHLEPEILIVDEVLAVGDAEFQKKCLGKMDEVSRRDGRTVLFVSHNMGAVTSLCAIALWLDDGSIRDRGTTREVISKYLSRRRSDREQFVALAEIPRSEWIKDDRLRFESIEWLCELPLRHGEPVKARVGFATRAVVSEVTIAIGFSIFGGPRLLTYETDFQKGYRPDRLTPGHYSVEVSIDALPLAPDIYGMDIGCRSGDAHVLDYLSTCFDVEVVSGPKTPGYIIRKGAGVRLASNWSWESAKPLGLLHLVRSPG